MRIIFYLPIVVLSAILFNCKFEVNDQNKISIDISKINRISLLEQFKRVELIPLETNSNSIINHIDKIIYNNSKYYIFDRSQKAIIVFTTEGKFLYKLRNVGKGPSEYLLLSDFEINRFTGNLELLSPFGQLLTYKTDGTFLRSIRLPLSLKAVHNLQFISKDTVVFYRKFESNRIVLFDRESNKIIFETHKIPQTLATKWAGDNFPLFCIDNKVMFYEGFSNTINLITTNGSIINYSWDFGKKNININQMPDGKKYETDYVKWLMNESNPQFIYPFRIHLENNEHIFTSFGSNKDMTYLFFNKSSHRYQLFSQYIEGVNFPHFALCRFGDVYLSAIDPLILYDYIKPQFLDSKNKQILQSVKKGNNPIIVKYYLNPNFLK